MSRSMANGTGQKVQGGETSSSQGPDGKKVEKGERLAKEKPDKPSTDKKELEMNQKEMRSVPWPPNSLMVVCEHGSFPSDNGTSL